MTRAGLGLGAGASRSCTADQQDARPAGPAGALFPADYFELERAELTAFVPVEVPAQAADGSGS